MGLLKKFLEVLGFEDKEVLKAQFDELYYQDVEVVVEEPKVVVEEPEVVVDIDPVIADYERLIRTSSDPAEKKDFETRLAKYKKRMGL